VVIATGSARGQLISIRTVPISQAEQLALFPSHHLAMGGISIALHDSLLDPFLNPATGARRHATTLFGSPGIYHVTNDAGGGRSLPLAALFSRGAWFGGLSLALQEIDAARPQEPFFRGPQPLEGDQLTGGAFAPLDSPEESHGNTLAFGSIGMRLPGHGLSIGAGMYWAGLHALDGVDLLYAGSEHVRQAGNALDVRVGVLKEWENGRALEALVLHHRLDMEHEVTYLDFFWDPVLQQQRQRERLDRELDRTNTWGLHLEYDRPLTNGWRMGWMGTVNRMSHPKIPNYEIMSIPRDPGHSSAFNVGVGLSRRVGGATFGVDLVYEPIWSETWADAANPVVTITGDTIAPGGKTIENRFRFSNAHLRLGVSRDLALGGVQRGLGLQLGLMVRSIHYWLEQSDNVQRTGRDLEEEWVEWMPTWGLSLRFPELEIRYRGQVTHGTGRPGVAPQFVDVAFQPGSILAAPSGPLTLDEVRLTTHQVSISLPLR
jgi:hypothetical protein